MDEIPQTDFERLGDAVENLKAAVRKEFARSWFRIYAWVIDKLWRATKGLR